LSRDAERDLQLLDEKAFERVRDRLKLLRVNPRTAANVTALVATRGYRMRIGDLRARFAVRDKTREVLVTRIVPRNEDTYKS
jgi:mRNA-degrading endonuclease RelE of RelBE toxin-antitoxin system